MCKVDKKLFLDIIKSSSIIFTQGALHLRWYHLNDAIQLSQLNAASHCIH